VSDPVLGARQALAPGLRPPLFSSAYEAAAWSVLSARRSAAQMTKVRERLGRAHGAVVDVDGIDVVAFPTPERLLAVERFEGIEPARLERLHGIAAAALDGRLDTARLRAMDPEEALVDLQRLAGIGPFYSALIVIRSLGHTDAFTTAEPRALAAVARAYGLAADASPAAFDAVADGWRPFRTWALFLFRATEGRATGTPTSAPGCAA
jgi:DNA-3-methyladenine glycosylase II